MITEQESTYNWQFLYLGADQDAIEVGGKMGIAPGRSLTYGRGSSQQAYAATSAVVGAMPPWRPREPVQPRCGRRASASTTASPPAEVLCSPALVK
ncbi:MAG: hypothetical protein R2703_07065 [Micropruina glycogenica]